MNQPYFLKNLPAPLQTLIRPMLLISLAAHGLLMIVPTASESKSEPPKKEEKVKLTELPPSSLNSPAPKQSALPTQASPTPSLKPTPLATPSALKIPPPISQRTVIPPVSRQIPPPPPPRQNLTPPPPPPRQAPPPPPRQNPPTQQKPPASSPSPSASPSPSSPSSSPSPSPAQSPPPSTDPFADFPQYPNAQIGSLGLFKGPQDQLGKYTQDKLEQVVGHFEQQLQAKGYQSQRQRYEGGQAVYQVSKSGKTQFVTVVFQEGKGTAYFLANQPIDLGNLQNVGVTSPEQKAFQSVLDQLIASSQPVTQEVLQEPRSFYTPGGQDAKGFDISPEPLPGIESTLFIASQNPDQLYGGFLSPTFQAGSFKLTQTTIPYGGGTVYQVQQGAFNRFINLIPAKGGGTVLFVWDRPPA